MFDQALRGCFGENDLILAGHPADEARAFEWLTDLRRREIGWKDARAQIVAYLTSRGASPEHIANQTEKAQHLLKPWLID